MHLGGALTRLFRCISALAGADFHTGCTLAPANFCLRVILQLNDKIIPTKKKERDGSLFFRSGAETVWISTWF